MSKTNPTPFIVSEKEAHRFWGKVTIRLPDQCWTWAGRLIVDPYGSSYGCLTIYSAGKRSVLAHRLAYYLHYNEQPGTLFVLHNCDNPSCVNPRHLFLGTHEDNMRDKKKKNRVSRCKGDMNGMRKHPESALKGEANPSAFLCAKDVNNIRNLYSTGNYFQQALADMFNVTQSTISRIIRRTGWKNIA